VVDQFWIELCFSVVTYGQQLQADWQCNTALLLLLLHSLLTCWRPPFCHPAVQEHGAAASSTGHRRVPGSHRWHASSRILGTSTLQSGGWLHALGAGLQLQGLPGTLAAVTPSIN
jgi:hypothetical protein